MKVHFTASNYRLEEKYADYQAIVTAVKAAGHTMTREWIDEDMARRKKQQKYTDKEYKKIWQKVKLSLMSADVVIIEGSINSFSIGYQTAYALSHKKPVLVMTNDHEISQTVVSGEDNPLLVIRQYDAATLESVVDDFLQVFDTSHAGTRFNMYIDRETQVFLELESHKSGKTKARIIRDMIKREIEHKNGL